jgi:hypothetical protein
VSPEYFALLSLPVFVAPLAYVSFKRARMQT